MNERTLTGVAARLEARIPRSEDFASGLRGPRTAARVGVWLGAAFVICFLTGLFSHALQHPPAGLPLPTGPARLYQVTQGLHVAAGTAAVPLLLVKLWSVFPRLFVRPPLAPRRLALHLLERGSVALLVGSAVFQLATGLANSAQWYPWRFDFIRAHFAVGWVAVGSVLLHVAVKLPHVRAAFGEPPESIPSAPGAPSRRSLLRTTWLSAGVAVLATTAVELPGVRRVAVLAVRSGNGPQGVPVNVSAVGALVADRVADPAWRLRVTGPSGAVELTRDELLAMPQRSAVLPIACVEGWSASGTWGGVAVRDVVALVGGTPADDVTVRSMQPRGAYRESTLPAAWVARTDSLLALTLGGEPLHPDHGYPCRLIAPARPGVLQTKWLDEVEVVRG
ncbi:molybdopterin-dependent oxidoreductase [Phycicoccus sp.]|uniref:molybdopterin-dependent oxidoreductase n=1 Tax=Phycicoccus sp. TaxID=1902410 RepID=UPI002CFEA657|nr:molybdopterin-dependent oxidoreductase [Phycicoccus sp.]HMM95271.1 molybdopterin-dependent oxidoreductase [Phycicoccus sp.]